MMDEINLKGCDKAIIVTEEILKKIRNKVPQLNTKKMKALKVSIRCVTSPFSHKCSYALRVREL